MNKYNWKELTKNSSETDALIETNTAFIVSFHKSGSEPENTLDQIELEEYK